MSWSTIRKLLAAVLIGSGITISVTVSVTVNVSGSNEPPVPPDQLGWSPELVAEARELVADMPEFRIVGDVAGEANRDKTSLLWHYTLVANNGEHLPNYPQQVGDCVSFGMRNAGEYLQCRQIYHEGLTHRFRPIYPPYIYGTSRVQIGGGRLRGDGSVGAWAAKAVEQHGVLFADEAGVPAYSGSVARDWGKSGPPEQWLKVAREFLVKTVSRVTSAQDVCDALCNGYPVTIASNFGTRTIKERDGRMVATWDSSWAHQMCVVGYDGSGSTKYFYVLNSWGAAAHPRPLNGEPPGGFWITWNDCERIAKQGDSFAVSDFEGFPALDFRIIGQPSAAPQQESSIMLISREITDPIWYTVAALLAIAGLLVLLFDRRRCRCAAALAVCLAGSALQAQEPLTFDLFGVNQPVPIAAKGPLSLDCFGVEAEPVAIAAADVAVLDLFGVSVSVSPPRAPEGYVVHHVGHYRREWRDDRGVRWWIDHLPSNGEVISAPNHPGWVYQDGRMIPRQPAKLGPRVECVDGKCRLVD